MPMRVQEAKVKNGKKQKKIVKVPLTPTPLPIAQYQGKWYIVIAAGNK